MDFETNSRTTEPPAPGAQDVFRGNTLFWGPNGLRAGWRLLIAFGIWLALLVALGFMVAIVPWAWNQLRAGLATGEQNAAFLILSEAISLGATLLTMLAMTKIEDRSFADYSMPRRGAFGRRLWEGTAYGLAMVSLMMALIASFHGYSLGGMALDASAMIKYGAVYAVAFLLVGLFEEATFRGYLQATLGSGIGFWPAALVLAAIFGTSHLSNPGEAKYGAAMAACFGLLAAFSLRRTGNLWFAIGMHAAWDWGESFLYSVPDSGLQVRGHLLNSAFHGPMWLTGGTVGPEASVFSFVTLLAAAAGVHFLFPRRASSE